MEELLKIQDILLSEAKGDPIAIPQLKKQQLGMKGSGYRTTVARWEKNGWIERNDDGTFSKTEAGMALEKVA